MNKLEIEQDIINRLLGISPEDIQTYLKNRLEQIRKELQND